MQLKQRWKSGMVDIARYYIDSYSECYTRDILLQNFKSESQKFGEFHPLKYAI